jgi:hypothetical protein
LIPPLAAASLGCLEFAVDGFSKGIFLTGCGVVGCDLRVCVVMATFLSRARRGVRFRAAFDKAIDVVVVGIEGFGDSAECVDFFVDVVLLASVDGALAAEGFVAADRSPADGFLTSSATITCPGVVDV